METKGSNGPLGAAVRGGLLAAGIGALVTACGTTPQPRVVTEAADATPQCQRVAWMPIDDRPLSLVDQQVRDALMDTMQRKGYTVVSSDADCLVYHRFGTGQAAPRSGPSIGLGVGGGSRRVGGGLGISMPLGAGPRSSGQLVVDVVDAGRNVQVWGGSVEMGLAGDQATREELDDAVARMLFQFPDRR